MGSSFSFKQFSVRHDDSALKVGTDAVVLGAAMTICGNERTLLDIGTGCGVIALMAAQRLASHGGNYSIDAIDIDAPSAAEAAFNFAASPWAESLRSICIPLARHVPDRAPDLIFSNPPFFENSLRNPDCRESAARHADALSYREICAFAAARLAPEGRLSLILPASEETALLRSAASYGLRPFRLLRIRSVESRPPRRLVAEFSRQSRPLAEEALTLQNPDGSRSPAYSLLTREFYL